MGVSASKLATAFRSGASCAETESSCCTTGSRSCASLTAFCPLSWAIRVPTAPRLDSWVSNPEICRFSLASTPTAGARESMPLAMVGPPPFSLPLRFEMEARASSMAARPPARELTPSSMVVRKERIGVWLPLKVSFSCPMMVCSWLIPPPLRTSERAPKVSSTLGAVLVELSGMWAPGARNRCCRRRSVAGGVDGGWRRMYSSPSGSSKRTWAIVPTGSRTDFLMSRVKSAWKSLGGYRSHLPDDLCPHPDLGLDRAD